MAIKEPPGTAVAERYAESKSWAEVALELTGMAARLIFGNLQIDADPLVIALNKLTTTHLISATSDVPFPICVLGEVNIIKDAKTHVTKAADEGAHAPRGEITESMRVRQPKVALAHVLKSIISVNGTDSNRKPRSEWERNNKLFARKDQINYR